MKVLITGAGGMLGQDLVKALSSHYEVIGVGLKGSGIPNIVYCPVDITDQALVSQTILVHKPDVVIHAAGYTDVDGAEGNEAHARSVNVRGTQFVAHASLEVGAVLFFISTDYVFDGSKSTPYQEDDAPNPISVYSKTKLEAERALALKFGSRGSIYIIRTSWLFGGTGKNFFRSILQQASKFRPIQVVDDQRGVPTYTKDLAGAFRTLIEKAERRKGCRIYHLANSGVTTWYRAAEVLLQKAHFTGDLIAIRSNELNRPAKRPLNSVLNTEKIKKDFGIRLRGWEDALDEFWNEVLAHEWKNQTKAH